MLKANPPTDLLNSEILVSDGMKQIPIKWTAPEALNFGKYTSLCDVWSYGILQWEIFSKGDTPYSGMSNSRARERIDTGYRMPAPENTPPEIYRLMLKCWSYEPESRPHFDEIFNAVDTIMTRETWSGTEKQLTFKSQYLFSKDLWLRTFNKTFFFRRNLRCANTIINNYCMYYIIMYYCIYYLSENEIYNLSLYPFVKYV